MVYPELEKAMEVGYKILKIHEVWHFPENQRRTHFFAPYVNKWLKKKSRRVRGGLQTVYQMKRRLYIREYEEKEGIKL